MAYRAIFMSDIHGNLPALEAVRQSLPEHDAVFVAGDLCLEGPCPAQVLDLLVESGWSLIKGNTDRDIVSPPQTTNQLKLDRVAWTRDALGSERWKHLTALPFSATCAGEQNDEVLVVHANPLNMDEHLPPTLSETKLEPYLRDVTAEIVVFGHLHTPYIRPVNGVLLVDVSSVGHPKDGDHRAAYTIISWDEGRRAVEQVRIPYDLERTVELLRVSDMPGNEEQIESLLKASY
jgi:predicted phosphodiesterase